MLRPGERFNPELGGRRKRSPGRGKLRGNLHLKAADGTPMANVMLTLLHGLGRDDMAQFGDSTGTFELTGAPVSTIASKG